MTRPWGPPVPRLKRHKRPDHRHRRLLRTRRERPRGYLVGAREQGRSCFETERLRDFEVDNELELRDLLHRQLGRMLAFEDATGRDADQAVASGSRYRGNGHLPRLFLVTGRLRKK